eukprot:CAMPEP_0171129860 /NCGR_PEP_ID=MMETSP0766_2-20121228/119763_1 /TAXON_ID=439317 /ORGANISM="Gambierdiscus australes, Strain CAWD 149" /LENGTH=31 /DNA_ID= /DNA_START= /DNA_END= /DNA_ORIENTATION=
MATCNSACSRGANRRETSVELSCSNGSKWFS